MLSFKTRIAAPIAALLFGACATDAIDADVEGQDSQAETATADSAPTVLAQAASSGKAHNTEIKYDDPNLKCYKLTGFNSAANKAAKYNVPAGARDFYVAFNVKAPWSGTQYIRSFKSIIDNSKVLHHWLLFRQLNATPEGVTPNAVGVHPDGEMLYGWAPGGDNMWFDSDVGMEVPGGSVFQLEMHYNNVGGGATQDASGVELCVTPTKPKNIAGLSWVGTDAISGTTATGTCTHSSRSPIQLIASQPHMHTKGINMRAELRRANGQSEVIHDKPFDFDYQRAYIHDVVINPGDKIITTCRYDQPARFGKGTSDEMCYFFSIHYPAGALARRSLGSIIHGPNTCID
ncbi:MAG: hypothetical protein ABW252_09010 [Polyangiales bacterium]